MSYSSVKQRIQRRLRQVKYYPRVAVEFPAEKKIVYMTEPEIRAIQLEAAITYKQSGKEAFDLFVGNFIIYDGPTKRKSKPMTLRTDGCFIGEFQGGFFDATCNLAIRLFDITD